MDSSQLRLLKEIQLVEFTVIEANIRTIRRPCGIINPRSSAWKAKRPIMRSNTDELRPARTAGCAGPGSMSRGPGRWRDERCGIMRND